MRARAGAVAVATLLVVAATAAEARPRRGVPAESWSFAAGVGVEALPDSVGDGLEPLALFGVSGTVRVRPSACLDARFGGGGTDDGSDTTRVAETRLRFDLRAAFCPALDRAVTLLFGAGPALGLSLLEARVREARTSYSAFDVGLTADAAVLLRLGPMVLRMDLEAGWLARLLLGAYVAAGVALD